MEKMNFEELEELEELKGHTEYPVGKVLAFEGEAVEAVGNNDERSYDGCALINYLCCHTVPCTPAELVDENYIKFKKHVTED